MEKEIKDYLEEGLALAKEWNIWLRSYPFFGILSNLDREKMWRWINKMPKENRPLFTEGQIEAFLKEKEHEPTCECYWPRPLGR